MKGISSALEGGRIFSFDKNATTAPAHARRQQI
jgi:hypothetical protein